MLRAIYNYLWGIPKEISERDPDCETSEQPKLMLPAEDLENNRSKIYDPIEDFFYPLPEEKVKTTNNNYDDGNVNKVAKSKVYDPIDTVRCIIRETADSYDYIGSKNKLVTKGKVYDPMDTVRCTIRETTENFDYHYKAKEIQLIAVALKKFDCEKLASGVYILVIGPRASGKTTLLKHIKDKLSVHNGLIFDPQNSVNTNYDCEVGFAVHSKFDSDVLGNYLNIIRHSYSSEYHREGSHKVIVIDDCDPKSLYNDKHFEWIMMNGRHANLSLLTSCQYPPGFTPVIRINFDYIFIFREKKEFNKKKLWEAYANMFPSYDVFSKILDKCTSDHSCLVIDNTSHSDKLDEQVFWYRVPNSDIIL